MRSAEAAGGHVPAPGLEIEVATWRPLEVDEVDGWRAGSSGGFTRRANSVVAARAPGDLVAALDRVESVCAAEGRPPIFRVCAESRPSGLDEVLAARGYARVAPTTVMVTGGLPAEGSAGSDRSAPSSGTDVDVDVSAVPPQEWLQAWLGVKASSGVDGNLARRILTGSPAAYLSARDSAGLTAVLRVAWAGSWAGLSCLAVRPDARRRGLGRRLTVAAQDHAASLGLERVFLQVEESNTAAVGLYRGLGFRDAARYHYRQLG